MTFEVDMLDINEAAAVDMMAQKCPICPHTLLAALLAAEGVAGFGLNGPAQKVRAQRLLARTRGNEVVGDMLRGLDIPQLAPTREDSCEGAPTFMEKVVTFTRICDLVERQGRVPDVEAELAAVWADAMRRTKGDLRPLLHAAQPPWSQV